MTAQVAQMRRGPARAAVVRRMLRRLDRELQNLDLNVSELTYELTAAVGVSVTLGQAAPVLSLADRIRTELGDLRVCMREIARAQADPERVRALLKKVEGVRSALAILKAAL